MSEKALFILYAIPNEEFVEETGAVKTTLSFHAANIRQARAKAAMLFVEQYPDAGDDDFKLVVLEDAPGLPRGETDVWDELILSDYDWDDELGLPVTFEDDAPEYVDFGKLSSTMKACVLVKYQTTEITKDQLPAALELTQDEAHTFQGHIVEALSKMPAIMAMYPERILEAISFVFEKCSTTKKWPEIKAQLANWLNEHTKERKDSAEDAERKDVIAAATATATAYAGRSYEHSYRTLNKEIAYALWDGAIHPAKTDPSISRWADGIIKEDREDWKRWSAVIVTQENILAFDRPTIFSMVRNAPKPDIYKFPSELKAYVTAYLADHGVLEGANDEKAEQKPQNAAGALADASQETGPVDSEQSDEQPKKAPEEELTERQGPFYFLFADGEKVGRANKLAGLQKALAEGCAEINQDEYQARKNGTYQASEETAEKPVNQPAVNKIADGVFSVENLMGEQTKATTSTDAPDPATKVEKPETETTTEPGADKPVTDFQSVAASLEKDLQEKPEEALDNLKLWRRVMRTDPRFTKDITGAGFDGTSVNAEYMIMRATELFGPLGSGWGYEIQEEKFLPGAPLTEPVVVDGKTNYRMLRDADGTLITEQHHSIRIRLWYSTEDNDGSVIAYGATPYMYKTNTKGIKCDGEAPKKSLTDAIKKALSMLGFSADVWLGMYDKPEYVAEVGVEFGIKTASEKAEDTTRLRNELDEKLTRVANTIETSVSTNEAKKVFDTIAREVEVHRKAADAKGDTEHAKYLAGRLRRLSQIKDQRIKTLTENQEQSA